MAIKREPVSGSSNIKSIGYADGVLEIEFASGGVYQYTGPNVERYYHEMMKAPSKGAYFTANIRHCKKTTCTKVFS